MDTPPVDSVPPFDLESFRVSSDVDEAFYIPNFITPEEEQYLLRKISESSKVKWRTLPQRRLQVWGGEITNSSVLIPQALPSFVVEHPPLIARLRATGVFSSSKHGQPNHIIVNEYNPGQGIMPHEDGSSYHPVVATISLGSHTIFHYHRYRPEQCGNSSNPGDERFEKLIDPQPILSLLLEPRSLIITAKNLYQDYLHSIEPVEYDIIAPFASVRGYDPGNIDNGDITSGREISDKGYRVSNWDLLADEEHRRVAREGGTLHRRMRASMTCRDVEKTLLGKGLGSGFSKPHS